MWVAVSDFWLDTEMSASTAHYIVRTILESPYSVGQAEAIHWAEVAPVLYTNLYPFDVAGQWGMFDPDWLVERCIQQALRPHRSLRTRWLRWFRGDLPNVVFERARRAERDGLPPRPDGPWTSLVASTDPLVYRVPW